MEPLRLGVNIDHVATIRNARGGEHPDPLRAAMLISEAGGDGVTAHLREDRRHIRDGDIVRLKHECPLPLNFEMALTEEMISMALKVIPNACCLVPERREERTTEHGLDVIRQEDKIKRAAGRLREKGIRVSLFVDPDVAQLEAATRARADIVEIHTGTFCDAQGNARASELEHIRRAAQAAQDLGLEVHAGHGLSYDTVSPIASLAALSELNIGHALIGEAVFVGFVPAVKKMRELMDEARRA